MQKNGQNRAFLVLWASLKNQFGRPNKKVNKIFEILWTAPPFRENPGSASVFLHGLWQFKPSKFSNFIYGICENSSSLQTVFWFAELPKKFKCFYMYFNTKMYDSMWRTDNKNFEWLHKSPMKTCTRISFQNTTRTQLEKLIFHSSANTRAYALLTGFRKIVHVFSHMIFLVLCSFYDWLFTCFLTVS